MKGASAVPLCSVCCEVLGKFGGPCTLPCGHNGCLQCMASVQQNKPECPLCRAPFDGSRQLVVNRELRDLVTLARALSTVEEPGGWQAITATKAELQQGLLELDPGQGSGSAVVLVPSSPRLRVGLRDVLQGAADLLSLEPPLHWAPDSSATACSSCQHPFLFLRRSRHHCRLCGGLYCAGCSPGRALLPPKFQQRSPQRVCGPCGELLAPLQPLLAGTISKAVQAPVHDVTDYSVLRSWLNNPLSGSLEEDLYKATNTARSFAGLGAISQEQRIPAAVLRRAEGFAILSVVKVGMGWSAALGTGLVVARRPDGSWSPPSALAMGSVGWGLQMGGELADLLIVLRSPEAVSSFCGTVHVGVGGNVALAVGPMGRTADATQHMGTGGRAMCYSYSLSRGMFAGISVEGSCMVARDSVNHDFYGRPYSARQLLLGCEDGGGNCIMDGGCHMDAPPPAAAAALYDALDMMMSKVGETPSLATGSLSVHFEEDDRHQAQPLSLACPVTQAAPLSDDEHYGDEYVGEVSSSASHLSSPQQYGTRRGRSPPRPGRTGGGSSSSRGPTAPSRSSDGSVDHHLQGHHVGSSRAAADGGGGGLYLGAGVAGPTAGSWAPAAGVGRPSAPPASSGLYPSLSALGGDLSPGPAAAAVVADADEPPAAWMGDLFD